jgi:uncharacterized protein YrzB (UPF0473 family)
MIIRNGQLITSAHPTVHEMNTTTEILTILQEEAAEVIQIASKIHRFGFNTDAYSTDGVFTTNARRLEQELGDLQCMIDLCIEHQLVDQTMLQIRTQEKREKLKTWSNIPI